MAEETFSDLGRVEAIAKLYEGTPYKPFQSSWFESEGKCFFCHVFKSIYAKIVFLHYL